MREENLSVEEAVEALEQYHSFKRMNYEYESLTKELHPLREEIEKLKRVRMKLAEEAQAIRERIDYFYDKVEGGDIRLEDLFPETFGDLARSNLDEKPRYRKIRRRSKTK